MSAGYCHYKSKKGPQRSSNVISPLYRWEDQGPERGRDPAQIPQQVGQGAPRPGSSPCLRLSLQPAVPTFTLRAAHGGCQASFQERKGSLQGRTLPSLKRGSLGTEDRADTLCTRVIIIRMHCREHCRLLAVQGPLRGRFPEPPSVGGTPSFFLTSPVVGQQAFLTIPALPASQASTQGLWATCQPPPTPALPPHNLKDTQVLL